MSASQQKKNRTQLRETGAEKRQVAKKKADKKAKKENRTIAIVSVALALLVIVLLVFRSALPYTMFTAVKAGNVSFTAADYSYYYNSSYYGFLTDYSYYIEAGYIQYDTSQSPAAQQFSEDMTWADYFRQSALSSMSSTAMLYTRAQEAGFVLSDEDRAELDKSIESFATAYEQDTTHKYKNADKFISARYGRGLTLKRVEHLLEMNAVAGAFAKAQEASYSYTPEELEAFYTENKNDYDTFDFLYSYISATADEANGITQEDALATAKTAADAIISGTKAKLDDLNTPPETGTDAEDADPEETANAPEAPNTADVATRTARDIFWEQAIIEASASPSASYTQGVSLTSDSYVYADWIKDPARVYGDMTVIENSTSGYYVMFFIGREVNDYKTVAVRHILIKAEANEEEDAYTDEAIAAAKTRAEEILAEWKAGDATEDSFASAAEEYSKDPGSNEKGGLYENFAKRSMVTEFNDWSFDTARKPGDTGIVYGETGTPASGGYAGYHVMYFSGYGDTYRNYIITQKLRQDAYSEWNTQQMESFTPKKYFTAKFVGQ